MGRGQILGSVRSFRPEVRCARLCALGGRWVADHFCSLSLPNSLERLAFRKVVPGSGGAGADVLTGGAGNDIFVFDSVAHWSSSKIITDFGNTSVNNNPLVNAAISINGDVLRFDLSNLAAMTGYVALTTTAPTGSNGSTLAPADFVGGAGVTTATATNAQFIFNSTTGTLYFDADGTGSGATPVVVVGDITYTGLTAGMILLVA